MRFWRRKKSTYLTIAEHARQLDRRSEDQKLLDWLRTLPAGRAAQIRNAAGLSRREVAAACGLQSASMVGKWETEGTGWSRHSGLRYAHLLKQLDAELVHERSLL